MPDASERTNPLSLTIVQQCALERDHAPSQTLLKVHTCHRYLLSTDICKNITELLDKSPGAELFGSGCAQSLVWHSPAALPSALPARLRALSGQKNTERMYMSVPMCRELWVDCSSAVWEMETMVTCGSNQNYLRSVGSSLLYHWVIVSFAFSFSGYFILPE